MTSSGKKRTGELKYQETLNDVFSLASTGIFLQNMGWTMIFQAEDKVRLTHDAGSSFFDRKEIYIELVSWVGRVL